MGMLSNADCLLQLERLRLQDPNLMIRFVAGVDAAGFGIHRQPRQENWVRIRARLHFFLQLRSTPSVAKHVNDSAVAAADIKLFAISGERNSIESFFQ